MEVYPDPRFETDYAADYKGQLFFRSNRFILPPVAIEHDCCPMGTLTYDRQPTTGTYYANPGYQPSRPTKGFKLNADDYGFGNVSLVGGLWPHYTYPPPPRK